MSGRRRTRGPLRVGAAALVGATMFVAALPSATLPADAAALTGVAGTDTSIPATDSAMTIHGRGQFAALSISVNQTAHLTNQAVSVTWSGATPGRNVTNNFLQIFQCWGDDDGTNADNPGPPPEQCEFGGEPIGASIQSKIPSGSNPSALYSRVVSKQSWTSWFDPAAGVFDSQTGFVWRPFHAVDGKSVDTQIKLTPFIDQGVPTLAPSWQNPYFDFNTTNEKPWARTYGNGTGAELFQLDTGLEAPGLGCGQKKQAKPDGSLVIPKCWLVVVPRGTAAEEDPAELASQGQVVTSPLNPRAWANRVAFPLTFNPVDSPCQIGANERRIVGSEYAIAAVTSWQPQLCGAPGSPPYAFSSVSDDQARQQLISGLTGAPGMAVVSRPYDANVIDSSDPVVYAPLSVSGVVVAFNIERVPTDRNGAVKEAAEQDIAATRVAKINLTPRLVAKLLTQSYGNPFRYPRPTGYEWVGANPDNITYDPDFLQFNPEFAVMSAGSKRNVSAALTETGNSDGARQVWEWVLADPEAKAWLDGAADQWGMKVNPYFATTAAANKTGTAFAADSVPQSFPKNDPYCYQDPPTNGITPRPLCLLDIQPYGTSLAANAQATRSANDGARTSHDPLSTAQQTANTWWGPEGPQTFGSRSILSITDSASAYRYGLQSASLSRAGDDGATRTFLAPDNNGLVAGVKAMVASSEPSVLLPDPKASAPTAYPLTVVTYAAAFPKDLDATSRKDYASFVEFATGAGQTPGVAFGQLPPGYSPLPSNLKTQAAAVAGEIRSGQVTTPTTTTTTTTAAGSSTTTSTTAGSGGSTTTTRQVRTGGGGGTQTRTTTAVGGGTSGTTSTGTTAPGSSSTDGSASTSIASAAGTASSVATSTAKGAGTPQGVTPAVKTSSFARMVVPGVLVVALLCAIGLLVVDEKRLRSLASWAPLQKLRKQVRPAR